MGKNQYKVLVIEDDRSIQSLIQAILEVNDYQVIPAESGEAAKLLAASFCPDLVLLDLGLPDLDGQELIPFVRSFSTAPIIVVSARTDETQKVRALDQGANDYVTKPFGTNELLARVRAAIRARQYSALEDGGPRGIFRVGELTVDYDKRRVSLAAVAIDLTQTEYNIVALLSQYAGKVLTYDKIIRCVWGTKGLGDVKKLQVNMANIRRKLGVTPGCTRYICTEMGVGYRMNEDEEVSPEPACQTGDTAQTGKMADPSHTELVGCH